MDETVSLDADKPLSQQCPECKSTHPGMKFAVGKLSTGLKMCDNDFHGVSVTA